MKIKKKKGQEERKILIGMIVDDFVLGRIHSKQYRDMFRSRWANIISRWCFKYYEKYNKAPRNHIETIFDRWSQRHPDKNNIELVEKFLSSLSDDYETLSEESNSDFIIDAAGEFFNRVRIERLIEDTQDDIDDGKSNEAHDKLISYTRVELGVGQGIDVFRDKEAIRKAFDFKGSLVKYPGDIGKFFGDSLSRGNFVSFMGPEKRGKSFWLADMAYRALIQRNKVALFEAGDMGEDSVIKRMMCRVSRLPTKKKKISIPEKIIFGKKKLPRVKGKYKKCEALDWKKAFKACKKMTSRKIKSDESYFKLSAHPNSTLSVKQIESILKDWAITNWVPDVIIIDYADILNMTYPGIEGRDCINQTWKLLRKVSQKYHCLLVTATQADSAAYGRTTLSMSNFSEDKRKLSHVTGVVGINCTGKEKEVGLMRLNWVVLREAAYTQKSCIYCAGCLDISNPVIKSKFKKKKKGGKKPC